MTGQHPPVPPDEPHVYLSTGCLHGLHAYCQARTGGAGVKLPATCKFCSSRCICECHRIVPALI